MRGRLWVGRVAQGQQQRRHSRGPQAGRQRRRRVLEPEQETVVTQSRDGGRQAVGRRRRWRVEGLAAVRGRRRAVGGGRGPGGRLGRRRRRGRRSGRFGRGGRVRFRQRREPSGLRRVRERPVRGDGRRADGQGQPERVHGVRKDFPRPLRRQVALPERASEAHAQVRGGRVQRLVSVEAQPGPAQLQPESTPETVVHVVRGSAAAKAPVPAAAAPTAATAATAAAARVGAAQAAGTAPTASGTAPTASGNAPTVAGARKPDALGRQPVRNARRVFGPPVRRLAATVPGVRRRQRAHVRGPVRGPAGVLGRRRPAARAGQGERHVPVLRQIVPRQERHARALRTVAHARDAPVQGAGLRDGVQLVCVPAQCIRVCIITNNII